MVCRDLSPPEQGLNLWPPAVEARHLSLWTSRKAHKHHLFTKTAPPLQAPKASWSLFPGFQHLPRGFSHALPSQEDVSSIREGAGLKAMLLCLQSLAQSRYSINDGWRHGLWRPKKAMTSLCLRGTKRGVGVCSPSTLILKPWRGGKKGG